MSLPALLCLGGGSLFVLSLAIGAKARREFTWQEACAIVGAAVLGLCMIAAGAALWARSVA
jgi:hypothetical protein